MPTLNMVDTMTALEVIKRANAPDPFRIIECLTQTNELLFDMPIMEANDGAVNTTLRRKSQPGGKHRLYNQGVSVKASQTDTVQDRIAMLEAYSVVDKALAGHSGNKAALRNSEAIAFINGMGVDQARDIIYGDNSVDKAEIDGFATRLNKLGKNCISMGGTGNNLTSIYLVAAGPQFAHLIYPKGSTSVGVIRNDLGEQTWEDGAKGKYQAYVEHFTAQYGITVRHPDAIKRLCNVPQSISGADLIDKILELRRIMPKGAANYVVYAGASVLTKIDKEARDKVNVAHTAEDPWGREITKIRDIRCRQVDVILDTEEAVA